MPRCPPRRPEAPTAGREETDTGVNAGQTLQWKGRRCGTEKQAGLKLNVSSFHSFDLCEYQCDYSKVTYRLFKLGDISSHTNIRKKSFTAGLTALFFDLLVSANFLTEVNI